MKRRRRVTRGREPKLACAAALALALTIGACASTAPQGVPGASAGRGKQLMTYYGCGACHLIGGIPQAEGRVGPPLTNFTTTYRFIVGTLPDTPANLARWIEDPQAIHPQTLMPNLGVSYRQALDMVAYLYGQ